MSYDTHNTTSFNAADQGQVQNAREPIDRKSDAGVTAAIWENDGKHGKFHNVTVSRSYKDSNGNYQNTNSFRKQDLPVLMEVLREAYGSIRTLEQANRREHKQDHNGDRDTRRQAFQNQRQSMPQPNLKPNR